MKFVRTSPLISLAAIALAGLLDAQPKFTTFNPPQGEGTLPSAINAAGSVVGAYYVVSPEYCWHGFLRSSDGSFTNIDMPGAFCSYGTAPNSINPQGAMTGSWGDDESIFHGFVRSPCTGGSDACTMTSFDAPGPVGATWPQKISVKGTITGFNSVTTQCKMAMYNQGSCYTGLSFLREPDGTLTTFDAPGASQTTWANDINSAGVISGTWYDASTALYRGFLRNPDATFMNIDAPDAAGPGGGTNPTSINPEGVVAGFYLGLNGFHGFVRTAGGAYTEFDPPGSTGTYVTGLDDAGSVTGWFSNSSGAFAGFLRHPNGDITTFQVPGAETGTQVGTLPVAINAVGIITGTYPGEGLPYNGFLRTP